MVTMLPYLKVQDTEVCSLRFAHNFPLFVFSFPVPSWYIHTIAALFALISSLLCPRFSGENPGHCMVSTTFTAIVEMKEAKEVNMERGDPGGRGGIDVVMFYAP